MHYLDTFVSRTVGGSDRWAGRCPPQVWAGRCPSQVSREEVHRSLTNSPPHSLPSVLAMPHAWDMSLLSDSYLALKAEAMIKLKLRGTSLNKHIQNFPSYNLPVWNPEPSPPSRDCSRENRCAARCLGSMLFYVTFARCRLDWEELARLRSKIIDRNFKI